MINEIKVFISYCQEQNIINKVLKLADRLNLDGINCSIDQYIINPELGWQKWMEQEIVTSNFVLIICTNTYLKRVLGENNDGRGVQFESLISYNEIARNYSKNSKFIPVVFSKNDLQFIPKPLEPFQYYNIENNNGYESLYRRISNQPNIKKPKTGQIKKLPIGTNLKNEINLNNNENVIVKESLLDIEIKINRDFKNYTIEEQETLLNTIKAFLKINGDIKIKQIREGSVIIKFEFTPEQCEKLHWAIKSGKFKELNIIGSEIEIPKSFNQKNVEQTKKDAALAKYLQEIGKIDLITISEEIELAKKIKTGDQKALEKLVKSNLRFVISIAKQYQNHGLTLPDLINEGNLGLIKAAQRFDEKLGFKFLSFAVWWIRQSIQQAIAENNERDIRIRLTKFNDSDIKNKIFEEIKKISHDLTEKEELILILFLKNNSGIPRSLNEISKTLGITTSSLITTLNNIRKKISKTKNFILIDFIKKIN